MLTCVFCTSYSFTLNGGPFDHIVSSRGIRHRNTMSPFLFIVCREFYLDLCLVCLPGVVKFVKWSSLKSYYVCNNCFLFCRASSNEHDKVVPCFWKLLQLIWPKHKCKRISVIFCHNLHPKLKLNLSVNALSNFLN